MDGDGPRQPQRELTECSQHLALNLTRLFVQPIARVLPLQRFHLDNLSIARSRRFVAYLLTFAADREPLLGGLQHPSYAAVIILMIARGVVLDEHHLGTNLQYQRISRGVRRLWKRALHFSAIRQRATRQFLQFRLIIEVSEVVVGRQADIRFLWSGDERGLTAAVQLCQSLSRGMAGAYLIEQRDKRRILLAVDMLQLDSHIVNLLKSLRAKEIRRVVIGLEHPFVLRGHDGSQLCQVANHQQLHATKGLAVITEATQNGVDGVEQVGTHHRDLVDDEQI